MTDGGTIHEARVRDASKPMALRTPGEVTVWLSDEKRRLFPSGDAIEDAEITILVKEIGVGKNGIPKLRGEVVPGIVQPAQFNTGEAAPLPQKPAPAGPSPKAA